MSPDQSLVEVIVPHRSRWDLLSRLLDSLERQTQPTDVCVVDNDSEDDSRERLKERHEIRLCLAEENLGFGRAVNLGVQTSVAKFIILLNNDMEPEPNFIEEMLRELQRRPRRALAALQLRPDGLVDTVGVAVDQSLLAYDVGRGMAPADLSKETLKALGPSGGAAGFRREEFLEVGGYDEEFFAYLEDVDLAIRLDAAGVRYALADCARVWHFHSATLGQGSQKKNYLMGWSRGYLVWKYRTSLELRVRIRGAVINTVIYIGQMLLDRNVGSLEGRLAVVQVLRSTKSNCDVAFVANNRLTVRDSLQRRFRRGSGAARWQGQAASDSITDSKLRLGA